MNNKTSVVLAETQILNYGQDILMLSLSEASRRQYTHTFKLWMQYCDANNIGHHELTIMNVSNFINSSDASFSTRKARLSHIRNLLKATYASNPDNVVIKRMHLELKLLKLTRSKSEKQNSQVKNALNEQQIKQVFDVFNTNNLRDIRNRCLIAVLFYAGLRRSEVVALKWTDFDLDNELVTVRHGKGDKERTIPILDGWKYIHDWHAITQMRKFVFCGVIKGDKLSKRDEPISTQTAYRVIKHLAQVIGIETLSPHDARRTLITNLINQGVPISDAQFIAGHEDANTTLGYAQTGNALQVANRVKRILKKPQ